MQSTNVMNGKFISHYRRLGFATIIAMTMLLIIATSVFALVRTTGVRTVDGIDWEGAASINWDTCTDPSGICYDGASTTTADETIDQIWAHTKGEVLCGFIIMTTDWDLQDLKSQNWIAGTYSDSGFSAFGACSWFIPHRHVVVQNLTWHAVWENELTDDDNIDTAWIDTGL